MNKEEIRKLHQFDVDEKKLETTTLLDPTYKLQGYQTNFSPVIFNKSDEENKVQEVYDPKNEVDLYPKLQKEEKKEMKQEIQQNYQQQFQTQQQQQFQPLFYPQQNQQFVQQGQQQQFNHQYPQKGPQQFKQEQQQQFVQSQQFNQQSQQQFNQQNMVQSQQQFNQQIVQQKQQVTKYSPLFDGNQIKFRSLYGFYLDYTKSGAPTSTFDGCIFKIEIKNNQLYFQHHSGYIVSGNSNAFDAKELPNGRWSIHAGGKFIGISPEGNIANYKDNSLLDTQFIIEDSNGNRSNKVGPFAHGNWVTLKNVANGTFFRYNNQDQPITDAYSPMVFFVEALPNKKFRLYYWKGFVVCTVKNEYDFEVFEITQQQKPSIYALRTSKFLGVDPKRPNSVSLYDSSNYNESRWIVETFNPRIYHVGLVHHRAKLKFRSYYFKNYYLTINLNGPLSLSQQGTIFTAYQIGNCFKIMADNLTLCTDHPSNNVFFVYCFQPEDQNGYSIGSGNPGKVTYIGSSKEGKIGLYNSYKFCESRWFIESIKN